MAIKKKKFKLSRRKKWVFPMRTSVVLECNEYDALNACAEDRVDGLSDQGGVMRASFHLFLKEHGRKIPPLAESLAKRKEVSGK